MTSINIVLVFSLLTFEHILHIFLIFLLLNLNKEMLAGMSLK